MVSTFKISNEMSDLYWHSLDSTTQSALASSRAQQQEGHTSCNWSLTKANYPWYHYNQTYWHAIQTILKSKF
jgi:hypothetical protein